jgi:hypothetical protein
MSKTFHDLKQKQHLSNVIIYVCWIKVIKYKPGPGILSLSFNRLELRWQ